MYAFCKHNTKPNFEWLIKIVYICSKQIVSILCKLTRNSWLTQYFHYTTDYNIVFTFQSLRFILRKTSCNIQKFCALSTVHLCVLCGSQNKQRLFLYTALTYRFLSVLCGSQNKQRLFLYTTLTYRFLSVLCGSQNKTAIISLYNINLSVFMCFCADLRTNSDYFSIQH